MEKMEKIVVKKVVVKQVARPGVKVYTKSDLLRAEAELRMSGSPERTRAYMPIRKRR
jgi:hypothetical protein